MKSDEIEQRRSYYRQRRERPLVVTLSLPPRESITTLLPLETNIRLHVIWVARVLAIPLQKIKMLPTGSFKTNFAVEAKVEAFYTGGRVQLSSDGATLFCTCGGDIKIVDSSSGKTVKKISGNEDSILNFVLSPDDKILVTSSHSGLLKQYDWNTDTLVRTWKCMHKGPINTMAFDSSVTLLATGGTDSTIKVWDIVRQYCTHNLKGAVGVMSVTKFHFHNEKYHLFGAADDYSIHVWDLSLSTHIAKLEGHFSKVTDLVFTADGKQMLSGGRDEVVIVWDIENYEAIKTICVLGRVESLVLVPQQILPAIGVNNENVHFITAGSEGILRVWSTNGKNVFAQKQPAVKKKDGDDGMSLITQALFNKTLNCIAVVTCEHNIITFKLEDFSLQKQFVGFNDDVLDVTFLGQNDSHFAIATNSQQIKVFDAATLHCQLLQGHTDIVLALDTFPSHKFLMASCSKDNAVRIWKMDEVTNVVSCVALGVGHTHGVGTVACARLSCKFFASGSQDTCLKIWEIPQNVLSEIQDLKQPFSLTVRWTEIAHEKDINSVCISPNDKLVATGSQDKVIKIWNSTDGKFLGALRGHRKGIWCLQFSPLDQVVASGSADGMVKIWSLSDFTCVKTFEGHECSVLKLVFLTRGMQILSSASDGLIKLWTIKSSECVNTMDAHEGRVWALRLDSTESRFISGAGDSNIIIWKDVTETEKAEELDKQEQLVLQEQQLVNLIQKKKYVKALALTITLEQPFRALNILKEILMEEDGELRLQETLTKLREDQIDAILRFAATWNQNSKHCYEAQKVLQLVLKLHSMEELLQLPNMKANLQGLLPYTDRHFKRLSQLMQQACFVDYTWQRMKMGEEKENV